MPSTFEELVNAQNRSGRESYARWNGDLFAQAAQGPASFLWDKTDGDELATRSFLTMLREAIGRGYLTQVASPRHASHYTQHRWTCLLEYWLNLAMPIELPTMPEANRVQRMAVLWNLGENILHDQPWIDPYLLKKFTISPPLLTDAENQIASWMQPLFKAARSATWAPPFTLEMVDGRRIHPTFLPGELRLSTPALVCVQDRRKEALFGGIFIHEVQCEVIAHHRHFGSTTENGPVPTVAFQPGRATINSHTVPLPFLNHVHSHLVCKNGVVLVSAADSQRLWVIRCR